MATEETVFVDGFLFKRRENAPDYVIGNVSAKIDELIPFLQQHAKNGWVNWDIKLSRSGNYYAALDTFVPNKGGSSNQGAKSKPTYKNDNPPQGAVDDDDLPF